MSTNAIELFGRNNIKYYFGNKLWAVLYLDSMEHKHVWCIFISHILAENGAFSEIARSFGTAPILVMLNWHVLGLFKDSAGYG